ncbi:acetyl-CoA carboxylase, carboxyltransferase subunit beta [Moraxella sp. FZLJ2107]|uniref:Acetyl-coenzyme A carboxylase carboxyl transferase subunit beta n=1 Tax=Moraxella porci DSM 25326 TaxID=573983 RepID=A0A1T0CPR8_9GAMM|nr:MULTISPECIES: acetyl-CoA carboxylase, carboxyltransferase subunit beta [Moraxella]MDH2274306.1 acetyl-CoA carboxylase, carboxyltransferase subunit beta [Moraxella porci]OOS24335.1 acetyl-CoA carboxylase subunit beta [Moraxella porci DSM 25326]USZ14345.1 acetyl-CoA carboxylase, carboxyltransferase subunit beta [Moraxella sp. FZFQ2102]UTO05001.1 acetyl-CoA carboxylase, carboxyltransferase subunit beta [Moraxella sp. FZLJ2107]UTO21735.1 acetyl-CoA carboxylase, carboxyltransferase subunit beta 
MSQSETATEPTIWLKRAVPGIKQTTVPTLTAVETEPSTECPECHSLTTNTALILNQYVCPECDHHLTMTARKRLEWFFDSVDAELGQEFTAGNPLNFVDSKPYPERMKEAQTKTGESEGLVVMAGKLKNLDVIACAFDFRFMGGSMGSVVGDRFVQAAEKALAERKPLVCFAASGGARMQEGLLSLMQMARTSAAIERLRLAGVPYVVILTNPVYGGVTASLAMLGDVHIAEPKAMIGFAGKRVIEQTVREVLDEPFQRAEFLLEKGTVDMVVHRHQLIDTTHRILAKLSKAAA